MTTNTGHDTSGDHLSALTAALRDSPSPVIIIDAVGDVVFVNEAFAEVTGYQSEDYSGIGLDDLEGGVGRYAKGEVWEALRAGKSYSGRYWAQRGEGEVYWLQTDASAIRDENGEIVYVLVIARELSSATAVAPPDLGDAPTVPSGVSPDLVLVADLHGTIQFISWTVPGLKREDVIGASIFEFVPPEERERLKGYIDRVIESGRAVNYEIDSVGANGTASRYVTQLGPVEHEGSVVAFSFASYAVDSPTRALHAGGAEARLRALANAAVEAVAIHDNGVILEANEVMAEMYGYDPEDVIGRHVREFAAPESRATVLARVLARDSGPYEAVGLRKDGSTFPVEICAKEVTYGGRVVRAAAIRDASGRRSMPAQQAHGVPSVRRRGQPKVLDLSDREVEVLSCLARGLTNRQVAEELRVSRRTIDHHVSHILGKLQAPNRLAAVNTARSKGLLRAQMISKI